LTNSSKNPIKILITGGGGCIGSAIVRFIIRHSPYYVINIDKLTYAANVKELESVSYCEKYIIGKIDICNRQQS